MVYLSQRASNLHHHYQYSLSLLITTLPHTAVHVVCIMYSRTVQPHGICYCCVNCPQGCYKVVTTLSQLCDNVVTTLAMNYLVTEL